MIKVFHFKPTDRRSDESFHIMSGSVEHAKAAWEQKLYEHVADVETDDLDQAFELTNTIHCHWVDNRGVTVHGDPRHRSTSVGDMLEQDGTLFIVSPLGFKRL